MVNKIMVASIPCRAVYAASYRFHLRAIDDNFQFSYACVPFEYFNLGGGATISIYFMTPTPEGVLAPD